MTLAHEAPLSNNDFAPEIGGSAGHGTHGGTTVERPARMPTKQNADYVVRNQGELLDAITVDEAVIYVDDDIDVTGVEGKEVGDGITLVGGFCDPAIPGRGPVIHSDESSKYVFTSSYGKAPTLWGISAKGPETAYKDPDHTADDFSETFASFMFSYDDSGTFQVYGCEFFGWTLAGILCGAKNHETKTVVDRTSCHHNQMEHLGYGIEHYNGFLSIDRCFFDLCRHGVSSFGYPNGGYAIANSVIGPGPWCGHALDMHSLANNLDTDDRTAGEFVRVYKCTFMSTWDRGGYDQEALAIRGEPVKTSYVDKCHFYHPNKPDPTGGQGDAYRQETGWSDTPNQWLTFEPRDNHFGESVRSGYGAPVATDGGTEPQPEPVPKPMKLTFNGRGGVGRSEYRFRLHGDASTTQSSKGGSEVVDNGDGTVTIKGAVHGGTDSFTLSEDANLLAYRANKPIDVTLGGEALRLEKNP